MVLQYQSENHALVHEYVVDQLNFVTLDKFLSYDPGVD